MGFWDFIAPDLDGFRDALRPVTPAAVVVGPVVLDREQVINLAWAQPGSGVGLAARLYYEASQLGVGSAPAQVLQTAADQQGSAGEFGDGGGFGGSFGWRSERTMAALVIPNVYRVAIEATSGSRPVTNVIGVRGTSSGQAQAAAAAVLEAWTVGGFAPLGNLPTTYSVQQVVATDLSTLDGQIAIAAGGQAGQVSGSKSTNAASALVKWGGGTRSRSSRGRLYFGPLSEAQIAADGRSLEPGAQTSIQQAFQVFRDGLVADGFTLCVISTTLSIATNVSTHAVEAVIATQRRRIRG